VSAPGDPGRTLAWVEGPAEEIVAKAVELIGTHVPDAKAFELRYEARDRQLADDEEPDPGEAVRWIASATVRRKYGKGKPVEHTYVGSAIADPTTRTPVGGHPQAIVLATVDLLERLGANTVVLFTDPTTQE
jgi:hypothetical protein